ncbi:hypothetical protein ACFV1N_45985 [Streptosporangium canum]|uniref:hypothetical protein n=1 Tax=Streptosporangium canum TaxID=324952 RepID=UPI0036936127
MYDDYDELWIPAEATALNAAADHLEEFPPDAAIEPRSAFLLARWFRSYAADVTRTARQQRRVDVDKHALELARHLTDRS